MLEKHFAVRILYNQSNDVELKKKKIFFDFWHVLAFVASERKIIVSREKEREKKHIFIVFENI